MRNKQKLAGKGPGANRKGPGAKRKGPAPVAHAASMRIAAPPPTWWAWPAALFAGAFLANAIPHTVMGITGQAFPTIFSGGPPSLSSAPLNVVWGAINLAIALALIWPIRKWRRNMALVGVFALGAFGFALMLSMAFQTVWEAAPAA